MNLENLKSVSVQLNDASDKLGSHVKEIEFELKRLSLGVQSWLPFGPAEDETFIGYGSFQGAWQILIARGEERWAFNASPRFLRVQSVTTIPALIEKLTSDSEQMIKAIQERIDITAIIVASIKGTGVKE